MTSDATLIELLGLAPGMRVAIMNAGAANFSEALSAAVGASGHVHQAVAHPTDWPGHSYDQIILANLSHQDLQELPAILEETRRLLRHDGRLFVMERGSDAAAFTRVVHTLEVNCW